MAYHITPTDWQTHQSSLLKVRERVFMQEQGVSLADELDGKDETAVHFLVTEDAKPIGCARVLKENNLRHIGRVAILPEYRQQHLGRQLMHSVLDWCMRENPEGRIYLHAQTERTGFYESLGFATHGQIFMDAGIPHIEMWYQQVGGTNE